MRAIIVYAALVACGRSPTTEPATTAASASVPSTSAQPIDAAAASDPAPFDGSRPSAVPTIDVRACKKAGDPTGAGHLTLVFQNDGTVTGGVLDQGPFNGTATGACVLDKYRAVRVPPFSGPPVRVGKSFAIN